MAINFFSRMLETINGVTLEAMAKGYGAVAEYVLPPFHTVLVIYFIIVGLNYLRNPQQDIITDLPFRMIKVGIILTIVGSWGSFGTYVWGGIYELSQNLGTAVAKALDDNNSVIGLGAQLDTSLGEGVTKAMNKMVTSLATLPAWLILGPLALVVPDSTVVAGPLSFLGALIELVCVLAFHAVAFYSILLSQIGVALAVMFAPLFICMYLFEPTRGMADSWARTVIGMLLLPPIVQGALVICHLIASNPSGETDFVTVVAQALAYIGMMLFMLQMPSFASGLVGSFNGSQATAGVAFIASKVTSAASAGASGGLSAGQAALGSSQAAGVASGKGKN